MTEPRIPTARNVRYYSEIIAKETGMPVQVVHRILMFGWKHICRMIENKQDVTLPRLGRLYFEKQPRYIRHEKQQGTAGNDPSTELRGTDNPGPVRIHPDPWDH